LNESANDSINENVHETYVEFDSSAVINDNWVSPTRKFPDTSNYTSLNGTPKIMNVNTFSSSKEPTWNRNSFRTPYDHSRFENRDMYVSPFEHNKSEKRDVDKGQLRGRNKENFVEEYERSKNKTNYNESEGNFSNGRNSNNVDLSNRLYSPRWLPYR
jgi:hypothetical protein